MTNNEVRVLVEKVFVEKMESVSQKENGAKGRENNNKAVKVSL